MPLHPTNMGSYVEKEGRSEKIPLSRASYTRHFRKTNIEADPNAE